MNPCASCVGSCCTRDYHIAVTHEEAERFGSAVIPADGLGPGFAGVLAKGPTGACIYHGADGCSVYEKRPKVCQDFSAETCGMYRPDPRKQLGLIRLRVVGTF